MKKKLIIPATFFLLAIFCSAFVLTPAETGSISGRIQDAASGQPIPFATIAIQGPGNKVIAAANSDVNGQFTVSKIPVGKYTIKASYIGYQAFFRRNVSITANRTFKININLAAARVDLDEIVILEDAEAPASMDNAADYSIISAKEVSRAPNRASGAIVKHQKQIRTQPSTQRYYSGTEQYDVIAENSFKSALEEPLSTFSIDVDAASYANVRRFINENQTPPKDAVRVEEMINYFNYDYPNPRGEHPFSIITELSECPWNENNHLVHVGVQGKRIQTENLPPNNLVFLIDVSGSMSSHNKLSLVKKSLKLLVKQLRPEDRVAIAVYAGAAGMVLESTAGNEKEEIEASINRLQSGGSTAGGAGIRLAYNEAVKNFKKNGNNRVILCTDGDFNVGTSSDDALVSLIEEKRKTGVYLTVLGYGMGNYKDSKMEKLADKGNGNYAYIDNIMEAKKVLVNEMGATLFTIAKDVKIQVEFNPAIVESYKLIGYENRLLAAEDFNNDTKDAGELGAGHSVTALYEVVPKGGTGVKDHGVDPLRYQKQERRAENQLNSKHDSEIMTVKIRYKPPSSSTSKLIVKYLQNERIPLNSTSENFKFSASVAEFGMLLRKSEFMGNANCGDVVLMAKAGKGNDLNGYRAEFIRLVEQMELQANN